MYMNKGGYIKINWSLILTTHSSTAWHMETINWANFRYFKGGFTWTKILEFLRVRHVYVMSTSTRWLKEKGMRKHPVEASLIDTSWTHASEPSFPSSKEVMHPCLCFTNTSVICVGLTQRNNAYEHHDLTKLHSHISGRIPIEIEVPTCHSSKGRHLP